MYIDIYIFIIIIGDEKSDARRRGGFNLIRGRVEKKLGKQGAEEMKREEKQTIIIQSTAASISLIHFFLLSFLIFFYFHFIFFASLLVNSHYIIFTPM